MNFLTLDIFSKPIFAQKLLKKGKNCQRLLEPQKVAPNTKSCTIGTNQPAQTQCNSFFQDLPLLFNDAFCFVPLCKKRNKKKSHIKFIPSTYLIPSNKRGYQQCEHSANDYDNDRLPPTRYFLVVAS